MDSMMRWPAKWTASTLVMGVLASVAGCGQDLAETVQQAASQAQESVAQTIESAQTQAKEQLSLSGSSEVVLDGPLKTPGCYVSFTPPAHGRQGVVTLRSASTPERESFPSFYLHAEVTAQSLAELAGQTVNAEMFLKPTADGPTWHAPFDQPVQLRFTAVAEGQVEAELAGGELVSTGDASTRPAAGAFIAVPH
jgi:hypothetical protein